ncbi:MAG: hypothetical protein AAF579_17765 [Cyanobacteria bacterium P01_C01_bin.118]
MKAYELNATVTADGHIELPEFQLSSTLPHPTTVKVIILVTEVDESQNDSSDVEDNFSEESFKRSWQQAINGDTVPVSQLWEEPDIV